MRRGLEKMPCPIRRSRGLAIWEVERLGRMDRNIRLPFRLWDPRLHLHLKEHDFSADPRAAKLNFHWCPSLAHPVTFSDLLPSSPAVQAPLAQF